MLKMLLYLISARVIRDIAQIEGLTAGLEAAFAHCLLLARRVRRNTMLLRRREGVYSLLRRKSSASAGQGSSGLNEFRLSSPPSQPRSPCRGGHIFVPM